MKYLNSVDSSNFQDPSQRVTQLLCDGNSGATHCRMIYVQTPPGGGSPEGLHTHKVDQIFYILEGQMGFEIDGEERVAGPGSVVVFPADMPHRNWNVGDKPTRHLSIATPLPDPDAPFATQVGSDEDA